MNGKVGKKMSKENPLDDSNAFTAGWSRSKMLHALREMLPYFTDLDLADIIQQISVIQKKRKQVQQSLDSFYPHELHGPGPDEEK